MLLFPECKKECSARRLLRLCNFFKPCPAGAGACLHPRGRDLHRTVAVSGRDDMKAFGANVPKGFSCSRLLRLGGFVGSTASGPEIQHAECDGPVLSSNTARFLCCVEVPGLGKPCKSVNSRGFLLPSHHDVQLMYININSSMALQLSIAFAPLPNSRPSPRARHPPCAAMHDLCQ